MKQKTSVVLKPGSLLQALQDYMTRPRYVCLGDIIVLPVHSTPLLGPVNTAADAVHSTQSAAENRDKSHSVICLRVVEMTSKAGRDGKTEVWRLRLNTVHAMPQLPSFVLSGGALTACVSKLLIAGWGERQGRV